jgi:hypothetical protein
MMGLAAAALISTVPMTASARVQHVSGAKFTHKEAINTMPIGTFKYKSAKRKPGTYGSSKSTPE